MTAEETEPRTIRRYAPAGPRAPLSGAALAAGLLEDACAPGPGGDALRLEVLRELGSDLKAELAALAAAAGAELAAVQGALLAADVANLAACAVPEVSGKRIPEAAAAARMAAGAALALAVIVEGGLDPEKATAGNERDVLKDARSAAWRARFASRQVDEYLEGAGSDAARG